MVKKSKKKPVIRLELGRGIIRFDSFQNLKNMAHGEILRSLVKRMSCLTTITQMTNESEISEMIDIINELPIPKKYLITFVETLDTMKMPERTINFNVMIYHRGKGIPRPILLGGIHLLHSQNFRDFRPPPSLFVRILSTVCSKNRPIFLTPLTADVLVGWSLT